MLGLRCDNNRQPEVHDGGVWAGGRRCGDKAAGAVVAGILAKQASQPAAAATGNTLTAGNAFTETSRFILENTEGTISAPAISTSDGGGAAFQATDGYTGVAGYGYGGGNGVYGESDHGQAVAGVCTATTSGPNGRGVYGEARNNGATGVYGKASGVDSFGLFGEANGLGGTGVHGDATNGTGVYGFSASLNTPSPAIPNAGVFGTGGQTGIYGVASALTGTGVLGQSNAASGIGVKGSSTNCTGVAGYSSGSSRGVYGEVNGANGTGVYGKATSTNSFGLFGEANGAGGTGVHGDASLGTGVYGFSASLNAPSIATPNAGVFGTGGKTGIYGIASSSSGVGMLGQCNGAAGVALKGTSQSGLGASLQGGRAPLLLVPGTAPMASLTITGHQAGELYVTSDDHLMFFTGVAWREVAFVPPAATPQAQPSGQVQPPAPGPLPAPQQSGQTAPGGPPAPLPPSR
jgi:hypothetical protein